ncbi:hypothetical protein R3W88_004996 [Solanum pinnatisectum]|uniref:DUF1985 domain-containing protein n=1 Tax=Solanum pinnatisectum TaxID=50273 RepID=A0AAV9KAW4_9SOLN|nr:hypothetical protein R3W88_004996 [Solanum pinnatisectum]
MLVRQRRGKEKKNDLSDEHAESIEEVISAELEQDEHEIVQVFSVFCMVYNCIISLIVRYCIVKFLGKRTPTRTPHMQCYINVEVMNALVEKLFETQYRRFCGTMCFSQLTSICRCHIVGNSEDAIMIHVNGTTLRFTIKELCYYILAKMIIFQYFDAGKSITKKQLVDNFNNKVWGDNNDDALKFAVLFCLVESDRYMDYPWGKKAFDLLIQHLHTKLIFQNISATPMKNLILDLPPEYVEPDATSKHIAAAIDSDDDFQDPPCPTNNKGKEKVESGFSAPMKKLRHRHHPRLLQNNLFKEISTTCNCSQKSKVATSEESSETTG